MLLLSGWLSDLYQLPRTLLVVMGVANLAYGTYSGWLARRTHRPYAGIVVLVVANATWAVLCVLLAVLYAYTASWLGFVHLVGEGMFVGMLAALEWRYRAQLLEQQPRR